MHEFISEGKSVTIRLPPLEDEKVPIDQRRVILDKWKTAGNVPLEYQVNDVDLEVDIERTIRVPEAMLRFPPNQFGLLQPKEQKQLDGVVTTMGGLAGRAFGYWLQVLRWKSKIGHIGEARVQYAGHGGRGAVLREEVTGARLWLQPNVITAVGSTAVSLTEWNATQTALTASKRSPIWFDFIFDSDIRINNNDLTGGILSLAIALEVNVRAIFSRDLRRLSVEPVLLEIFDQTNLRALLNRIKRLKHWDQQWEQAADLSSFNTIMNYRDRVMHSAATEKLDAKELRRLNATVKEFGYFTCEFLGLS